MHSHSQTKWIRLYRLCGLRFIGSANGAWNHRDWQKKIQMEANGSLVIEGMRKNSIGQQYWDILADNNILVMGLWRRS